MTLSGTRVAAVVRKEWREFRRNRFIIATTVLLPLVFVLIPTANLFRKAAPAVLRAQVGTSLLVLLIVPVILPATIAAYTVVGEREQGTLEPVLTTPIRREELLLGKAIAAVVPAIAVAYAMFAIVVTAVRFGAPEIVQSSVWQAPNFLTEALFAPLLSAWSIWVGIAVSTRSSDVRVAQQLGTLASLPPLGLVALMSYQVIQPSVTLAVVLACAVAAVDVVAYRVVAAMFDRERLITGATPRARNRRRVVSTGGGSSKPGI